MPTIALAKFRPSVLDENIAFVRSIESRQWPIRTVETGGANAAHIYHSLEVAELRRPR